MVKNKKCDPKELKKLKDIVETTKDDYDNALQNTTELQTKVKDISEAISKKVQGKLGTVNDQIKEKEKQIKQLETKMTKLEVEIRTAERFFLKNFFC